MPTAQGMEQGTATPPQTTPPPAPPRHRRGKRRALPRLDHCLNCDRATGPDDNFCPSCGQENTDGTVPLKPLVADALSEIASWDSKLVRTVLPLLFRPGFLTNEFLAGRRVRYLSPLKMYLFISALFFLLLSLISQMPGKHANGGAATVPARASGPKHVPISGKGTATGYVKVGGQDILLDSLPKTTAAYDAQQHDPHNRHRDGFLKALMSRQIIKSQQDKQTFEQSIGLQLLSGLPKMMFALLPLFALLLKVTYWRRKRLYIEHLVFALHNHAFLFTLLTLPVLAAKAHVMPGPVAAVCAVVTPLYLLVAQRRVYKQGWPKTVFKFCWLAFNYFILLVFALTLTALAAFLLA